MRRESELKQQVPGVAERQEILPWMAALFAESFGSGAIAPNDDILFPYGMHQTPMARIFRLPLIDEEAKPASDDQCFAHEKVSEMRRRPGAVIAGKVRSAFALTSLVNNISRSYNNIAMGILGNATLARLQFEETSIDHAHAWQMERVIQSGSFLIHIIFDYLSQEHIDGKHLRLHRLFKAIQAELADCAKGGYFRQLEAGLQWALSTQSPRQIAGRSARVITALLQEIQFYYKMLVSSGQRQGRAQKNLDAIQFLLARGTEIADSLRFYAGDFTYRPDRVQLLPLIHKQISHLRTDYPNISVELISKKRLPHIRADRRRTEFALWQILVNAVEAQPGDAAVVRITLRRFQDEAPAERCGVHSGKDYVVITIQDAGPGISSDIQENIFEPFFRTRDKRGHAGMGLAAAAGIIRAHQGYIQVTSQAGHGASFKVYLPLQAASDQERALKRA